MLKIASTHWMSLAMIGKGSKLGEVVELADTTDLKSVEH